MTALWLCALAIAHYPPASAVRACRLAPHAVEAGEAHGIDPALLLSIGWVETRWKPWLVGSVGEHGALQVRPEYAGLTGDELAQPGVGVWAGAGALSRWRKRAGGRVSVALAAYNCGNRGLTGACGGEYARRVLAALGRLRW